ncbi:hypothetical protein F5B22DRAFT_586323 [Xylaria bambusicola]|uniref:uncharacterized protein n=1 Tax=Xylaria bambusicola TaxID=326684 RepID=UPI002007FBDE|nr:uncharacterized protein F5B22DRAFT_586323 [Xylaria bambusicola]KAI0526529.1 hypothetical protein F5B22DRAFT_586323 [Xylaria bambusicola]
MPSILKNCVVSIAGDLDDNDWREEKVKQWVKYQGGKFTDTIDENVTHLLCTEANYKKKIAPVRAALMNKATKIVYRDWLEDSINKKSCLKTLEYQLDAKEQKENAKKRRLEKNQKCSSNAEYFVDERFWHAYHDETFFKYQVQLTRADEESGDIREKHLMTLWESNAKPYNYICTTLYTKRRETSRGRFPESPVDFNTAFRKFKGFFKKKTNIGWDDRINKVGTTSPESFQYQPPSGGKPVGIIKHLLDTAKNKKQHSNNHLKSKASETSRKHPRESYVANNNANESDNVERSAKRSRHEGAEIVCSPVEVRDVSSKPKQSDIIDSNTDGEYGTIQVTHEQPPGDNDTASERELQLESSNEQPSDRYEQEQDSPQQQYDTSQSLLDDDKHIPSYGPETSNGGPGYQFETSNTETAIRCTTPARDKITYPEVEDDYYTYDDDYDGHDAEASVMDPEATGPPTSA